MIKVAVPGVKGRMGALIAQEVCKTQDLELAIVTVKDSDSEVGTKYADTDLIIASDLQGSEFAVLIDFTSTTAVMQHLEYCVSHNIAMVIGVTGFTASQLEQIHNAAYNIPILLSANMSIGVNNVYKILEQAAKLFDASWRIEVAEVHHINKKDAPSGTAKELAKILAKIRNVDEASIDIKSQRYGDAIGSHSVTFYNDSESVTIYHIANNRDIFAKGAVRAAKWINGKKAGLYNMLDVIEAT